MRDGIYVTAYFDCSEIGYYHNWSIRHDPNFTIWKKTNHNIDILKTIEIERISGIKYHAMAFKNVEMAYKVIETELDKLNINIEDVVEIWGTPILDHGINTNYSMDELPNFTYHSICHLFSSIFQDSDKYYNEEILGLAIDGGSDSIIDNNSGKYNYVGCYVKNGSIEYFPISSHGPIWWYAAQCFDIREGTLMALASATTTKLSIIPDDLLIFEKIIDTPKLAHYFTKYKYIYEKYDESNIGKEIIDYDNKFSFKENIVSAVMKNIQNMTFDIMDYNIDNAIKKYNIDPSKCNIALSGGSILNCPANTHIMEKYNFKNMMTVPNVSDTGMSLGMGLYAFSKRIDRINFKFSSPYLGNEVNTEIHNRHKFYIKTIEEFNPAKVVSDIKKQPLLWLEGKSEVGPRALGHRSILADPTNIESKEILNKIKGRQWWRPVAPIILLSELHNWFNNAYASPYMLNNFFIKESCKELVPAILHIDKTARIQTVDDNSEDLITVVLKQFNRTYKIPILCNTSLNDKGEPIIESLDQAINFAMRKGINIVYCNGKRYELFRHNEYDEIFPLKRDYFGIEFAINDLKQKNKLNPYELTENELHLYLSNPNLYNYYKIANEKEVSDLKKIIKYMNRASMLDKPII